MKSINLNPFNGLNGGLETGSALENTDPEWWVQYPRKVIGKLGEANIEWDCKACLHLIRDVCVDTDRVRQETGLPKSAKVRLCATWRSSAARFLKGKSKPFSFSLRSGLKEFRLSLKVSGEEAGQNLRLATWLLLEKGSRTPHGLEPSRPGSVLWSDVEHFDLEGDGSRMPMEVIDFKDDESAGWEVVVWNPAAHISSAMTVRINGKRHDIVEAITASKPNRQQRNIRTFIAYDVGRAMIESVLEGGLESETIEEGEEETLNSLVLARLGPGTHFESVEQARGLFKNNRLRFERVLQGIILSNLG